MKKLERNQERANEAMDRILLASRTGQGPFKTYSLPQECRNYPQNLRDERDLANFLFVNLLHQSGGSDSENSFRGHRRLHELCPEIYDPRTVVNYSADEIGQMMRSVGLTLTKRKGQRRQDWLLHNAEILNLHWRSDPRTIFVGLPAGELDVWWALLDRVVIKTPWKLMGFQEKMLSLFVHLFTDARLVEWFDVPPAIDIHQNRFFGALNLVGNGQKVGPWSELNAYRDQIRLTYIEYSHSRGVSMQEIGEAVWYYAREMCKYAPGAISKKGTYIGAVDLNPDSGKRPGKWKPYRQTCGNCLVSDLCMWNMPHSYHYNRSSKQGGLVFVPRPTLPDERPLQLDASAQPVARCTRHQGMFWSPNPTDGCIGCGECGATLELPVRLREKTQTNDRGPQTT